MLLPQTGVVESWVVESPGVSEDAFAIGGAEVHVLVLLAGVVEFWIVEPHGRMPSCWALRSEESIAPCSASTWQLKYFHFQMHRTEGRASLYEGVWIRAQHEWF